MIDERGACVSGWMGGWSGGRGRAGNVCCSLEFFTRRRWTLSSWWACLQGIPQTLALELAHVPAAEFHGESRTPHALTAHPAACGGGLAARPAGAQQGDPIDPGKACRFGLCCCWCAELQQLLGRPCPPLRRCCERDSQTSRCPADQGDAVAAVHPGSGRLRPAGRPPPLLTMHRRLLPSASAALQLVDDAFNHACRHSARLKVSLPAWCHLLFLLLLPVGEPVTCVC